MEFELMLDSGGRPGEVGAPFALYNTRPRHGFLNLPSLHATNMWLRLWEIAQHQLT